jgi:hypothetical protein
MLVAKTFGQKLKGFLFSEPIAEDLLILNCADVHTWLMRYRLHIAFVDSKGYIIRVCNDVVPNKRIKQKGAAHTIETFSKFVDASNWYKVGDKVNLLQVL